MTAIACESSESGGSTSAYARRDGSRLASDRVDRKAARKGAGSSTAASGFAPPAEAKALIN